MEHPGQQVSSKAYFFSSDSVWFLTLLLTLLSRINININVIVLPTNGDRLVVAVGLMGSEDPADSAF